jgi:hypothetical protein
MTDFVLRADPGHSCTLYDPQICMYIAKGPRGGRFAPSGKKYGNATLHGYAHIWPSPLKALTWASAFGNTITAEIVVTDRADPSVRDICTLEGLSTNREAALQAIYEHFLHNRLFANKTPGHTLQVGFGYTSQNQKRSYLWFDIRVTNNGNGLELK